MLCEKPKTYTGKVFNCGKCPSCLINRRRMLTARLILESLTHSHNTFITLTYKPLDVPLQNGTPVLSISDASHFLDRLRKRFQYRYFLVGEYGSQTKRPHYHAIIFGHEALHINQDVADCWPFGFVDVKPMVHEHMAYCAQYTIKKGINELENKPPQVIPEFTSRSRMPGLGTAAVPILAAAYDTPSGEQYLIENENIIPTFNHQGKTWPLDHFMQTKLQDYMGIPPREPDIAWENWESPTWLDVGPDRNRKRAKALLTTQSQRELQRQKNVRIRSGVKGHGIL